MQDELIQQTETLENEKKLSIKNQFKTKKGRMRFITRVSMFSALSTVFYVWLKFPLPFFPPILKVSFSNLFIMIGSLLTGPIGGVVISIVRFLLKLILNPTSTGFIGEITDLVIALSVALPASITYLIKHDKSGGILGIIFSFFSWIIVSFLINLWVSLPLYLNLYGLDACISMFKSFAPSITEENLTTTYLFYFILPFNSLVAFVNSGVALIVYKKTSTILKAIGI
ncbi:ECF transporter S component [bacterium]|nr:ECF transporter S component [bacterium]